MARRGSYAKGIAKREEILGTALDIVARVGYSRATVREIAQAAGLTQTGVLHYFGTKEQLFIEILRRRDEVDQRLLNNAETTQSPPDLARTMIGLLFRNAGVPGLVQLYSRFSSEAAEPGHAAHAFFRDRYAAARSQVAEVMRKQQEAGSLSPELDVDRLAAILFAVIDGLQMQWMYDPEIDMADHLAYLWKILGSEAANSEADPT
jgi:AcrR family transcriptional regulator